ncbi:Trypanosome variant surface glycoprotein (A-type) [Trypanosoma brucei equiperdum]|nr:variant surface glycoprotein 1125.1322 [Trypanosoma brucei]RHW66961.1 Trypanosome variant surface glycoprotein (A-type) [Trypanosoma brucei equiperdum]
MRTILTTLGLLLGVTQYSVGVPGAALSVAAARIVCEAAMELGRAESYISMKLRETRDLIESLKVARRLLDGKLQRDRPIGEECLNAVKLIAHADGLGRKLESQYYELERIGFKTASKSRLASGRLHEFILVFSQWHDGEGRCIANGDEEGDTQGEVTLRRCMSSLVNGSYEDGGGGVHHNFPRYLRESFQNLFTLDEDVSLNKDNGCPLTRWKVIRNATANATGRSGAAEDVRWAGGLLIVTGNGPRWISDIEGVPMLSKTKTSLGKFVSMSSKITSAFSNFMGIVWADNPWLVNSSEVDSLVMGVDLYIFMHPSRDFQINERDLDRLTKTYCGEPLPARVRLSDKVADGKDGNSDVSPRGPVVPANISETNTIFGSDDDDEDYNGLTEVKAGTELLSLLFPLVAINFFLV